MFRIQLALNTSSKTPVASKILLVEKFEDLLKQAAAKFKYSPKRIRFFVAKPTIDAPLGTEIASNEDFLKCISDDVILAVSNGEPYKRKVLKESTTSYAHISFPPRYPYPTKQLIESTKIGQVDKEDSEEIITYFLNKDSNTDQEMRGIFPVLKGNVCNMILKIVSRYEKIRVSHFKWYISIDYDDNMIFPESTSWEDALLRECRGLIISTTTGYVCARRFHKFFNINEKNESMFDSIDFRDAQVYEKFDGSLVSPILLSNDTLIWATRRTQILEVEQFITTSSHDYNAFAMLYLKKNITPLFEWCHDTHAVGVLCYPKKDLILLALRDNETGQYYEIPEDITIPHVKSIKYSDASLLIRTVRKSVGREGVVIRTKDGNMYKLKSDWYVMTQASQMTGKLFLPSYLEQSGSLKHVPIDKIFISAISSTDDVIALAMSHISTAEAIEFRNFVSIVQQNISILEKQLLDWAQTNYKITVNKDPILMMADSCGWPMTMIEDLLDKKQITAKLKTFLIDLLKLQKVNIVRELLDVDWNTENAQINSNDICLDIITFQLCPEDLKTHVLTKYLPRKLSNMFGEKVVLDTIVNIPDTYEPNEGKIVGMWEQFTKDNIYDLRIDLQPKRKEYSEHYGNSEYALFLVQYGLYNNDPIKPSGEFAGILLPTNCDFTFNDIVKAFDMSFETLKIVKLKRRSRIATQYKIFCDLDGVLADFEKGVLTVTGRDINNQSTAKMWQRILTYPNFFETLDWTPYGETLWNSIKTISDSNPTILTGVPSSKQKTHITGKKNWCSSHLGSGIEVITCNSAEKWKYSKIGHVLIDDRLEMGRQWQAYGGTFIHHIEPDRTIYELNRLFNKLVKCELSPVETLMLPLYTHSKTVHYVTHEWIPFDDTLIAIDSEWNPEGTTSDCSIVQIGTLTDIYIVDMLNTNEVVKERLYAMLQNDSITKICFGMDISECFRIGSDCINVIDLQETAKDLYTNFANTFPSLSTVTSLVLLQKLNKSKEFQAGDWNLRPLTDEQMIYATNDVSVLLDLHQCMSKIPSKNIYLEKSQSVKKSKNDFDPLMPVKVIYSGIFLTPSSKTQLLKLYPTTHKTVYADHITLAYMPLENDLRGLQIGETVMFTINGYYTNDKVQAVRCEYNKKEYHVTISTAPAVPPKESKNISEWIDIDHVNMYGIIGVMTQQEDNGLCTLPEKISEKIKEFEREAKCGETLKFKPNELSSAERAMVHEYAKHNYMTSESSGKDDARRLVLTMGRKTTDASDHKPRIKITDMYQYSVMNIISNDSGVKSDGTIGESGIENASLRLQTILSNDKKLIIMRGLPGSGKSSLAQLLSPNICSADDYFVNDDGVYEFDKGKLTDAHEYCLKKCHKYIDDEQNTIVIDNTNSTHNEYKKYVDLAYLHGYTAVILEIYCINRNQAVKFTTKGVHDITPNDVLKMLARWETDDTALLLMPYDDSKIKTTSDESFSQWLNRMRLTHFNKTRRKTHMHMQVGSKPLSFIDVPLELYDQFYQKYANSDENKYIMEVPAPWSPYFRMYFDIDYISDVALSIDEIKILMNILLKVINNDIYVTWCVSDEKGHIKTGVHVNCPNTHLTMSDALKMRLEYIELLKTHDPSKGWEAIIDESVYSNNRGSRMYGSRKTTRGIDVGKLYSVLFGLDKDGNELAIPDENIKLLKLLSTQIFD
jgi:hypothetical protein